MATGGDLLFQGGPNEGVFRAINAKTGEIVWTFKTGSNFRNSPITYVGPDGRQYVAVIGSQAAASERITGETPPDSSNRYRRSGSTLYVFALGR
jgi:glucose dehydrogenase